MTLTIEFSLLIVKETGSECELVMYEDVDDYEPVVGEHGDEELVEKSRVMLLAYMVELGDGVLPSLELELFVFGVNGYVSVGLVLFSYNYPYQKKIEFQ